MLISDELLFFQKASDDEGTILQKYEQNHNS